MKINVSATGEILIDDKVSSDDEVAVMVETLNRARGDAKEIQKLSKTIETLRKEYNGSGKSIKPERRSKRMSKEIEIIIGGVSIFAGIIAFAVMVLVF